MINFVQRFIYVLHIWKLFQGLGFNLQTIAENVREHSNKLFYDLDALNVINKVSIIYRSFIICVILKLKR